MSGTSYTEQVILHKMATIWNTNFVILLFLYICVCGADGNDQIRAICKQQKTCSQCIVIRPECAWCNDADFDDDRCSTSNSLTKCKELIFPNSNSSALENRTLQDGSETIDPVQLQPQRIKLTLRPGKSHSFSLKYRVAKNLPLDMYFILDFTSSMKSRLLELAGLMEDLINGLEDFTNNIQIGYGSFVDKVVQPFTFTTQKRLENPCFDKTGSSPPCAPPYGFIHKRSLNTDVADFTESVRNANTSSSFDEMEGGMDAILQAILCPHVIGWRNQSRRVMIYISDGGFHFAGDGKLGGIDLPCDGLCNLEPYGPNGEYKYTKSEIQDYPSLAQVADAVDNSNINLYFLVEKIQRVLYEGITELSEQIKTNIFEKNSGANSNSDAYEIVNTIVDEYKELTKKVTIAADDLPPIFDVMVSSDCGSGGVTNTRNLTIEAFKCTNIEQSVMVNFNVTITAKYCPKDDSIPRTFVIAPKGLQEKLVVEVDFICDCNCTQSEDLDQKCSGGNGTYECGVCRCKDGRSGEFCQCDNKDQAEFSSEVLNKDQELKCKVSNDSEIVCSQKGNCNCGQCSCFKNYFGKYCECEKKKCQRPGNENICSGNGDCSCTGCNCFPGFSGDYCECPPADCLGENGICNGRGECKCGKCECFNYFNGTYCQECKPQYLSKCETCAKCGKNECVKCLDRYPKEEDATTTICKDYCAGMNMTKVDNFGKDEIPCPVFDTARCEISYIVSCDDFGSYLLIANKKVCPNPPDPLYIAMPLLAGIIGVAILLLIIWKILTSFYDKIEYARFEHEIQNPKWSQTDNPIYKTATTTNQNPMYQGDKE